MQNKALPFSTVLVGYFNVPGVGPDSVEVPCTGKGKNDRAALVTAIYAKHAKLKLKPGTVTKTGAKIERRTGQNSFIELSPGMTIANLFVNPETDEAEQTREIGGVFFKSSPMKVVLVLSRAAGHVRIQLTPVLPSETVVRFSNQLNPQRLAEELPLLVTEVLGGGGRELKLNFRKKLSAKAV